MDTTTSAPPKKTTAADFNALGKQHYARQEYAEALACFDEALRLDPSFKELHEGKGNALIGLGCPAEALACFDEALRLDPSFKEAHQGKGNAFWSLGRLAEALDAYNDALSLDSSLKEAQQAKGNALLNLGRPLDALVCFIEVVRIDPTFKEAHQCKGNALWSLGCPLEALASYNEALRLDSSFKEAHYGKGIALWSLGCPAESLWCFKEALRLDPSYKPAYNGKGNALLDLGRSLDALACYNEALHLDPSFKEAYHGKGTALWNLGRPLDALSCYNEALRLNPSYKEAYQGKGNALWSLGRLTEALACYNQVLRLDPSFNVAQRAKEEGETLGRETEAREIARHSAIPAPVTSPTPLPPTSPFAAGGAGAGVGAHAAESTAAGFSTSSATGSFPVIPYAELAFAEELGRGAYGVVYKGRWKSGEVAIKQLVATLSPEVEARFAKEILHHGGLHHENIVRLLGVCLERRRYCMVVELMPEGSLSQVLKNGRELPWELRWSIVRDIAAGLAYLHERNIVHQDLKSPNVLIGSGMRAKLADFGLARVRSESLRSSSGGRPAGTPLWMAPELFHGEACSKVSDVYSFGVVAWEVASRREPLSRVVPLTPAFAITKIIGAEPLEDIPAGTPPSFAALIGECWAKRKELRPSSGVAVLEKLREKEVSDSLALRA